MRSNGHTHRLRFLAWMLVLTFTCPGAWVPHTSPILDVPRATPGNGQVAAPTPKHSDRLSLLAVADDPPAYVENEDRDGSDEADSVPGLEPAPFSPCWLILPFVLNSLHGHPRGCLAGASERLRC